MRRDVTLVTLVAMIAEPHTHCPSTHKNTITQRPSNACCTFPARQQLRGDDARWPTLVASPPRYHVPLGRASLLIERTSAPLACSRSARAPRAAPVWRRPQPPQLTHAPAQCSRHSGRQPACPPPAATPPAARRARSGNPLQPWSTCSSAQHVSALRPLAAYEILVTPYGAPPLPPRFRLWVGIARARLRLGDLLR